MEMNIPQIMELVVTMTVEYAPRVLLGILTIVIGFWLIKKIVRFIDIRMEKSGIDISLAKFLSSVFGVVLKVLLLFSAAAQFGIETTSFLAIFSALMVGVGMALNGTIGHLASGVMILLFKPFKVGDLVIIGGGNTGTVEAINAFNTTLATMNNRRIIVANSNVTGNDITNISGQGVIGVELTFGIGYNDSIDKAREIILRIGKACPLILDDPKQGVVVGELADSSVNLNTRPFCKSEDYWDAKFYMIENVKKAFDAEGISIPFPQMDIHRPSAN